MSQRCAFQALSCAILLAALAPGRAAEPAARARKPARKAPARAARQAAPAPQARPALKATPPMAAAPAARPAAAEKPAAMPGSLADFGAALREEAGSAAALAVLPASEAAGIGLMPGDRLVSLNGAPTRSRSEARAAWQRWDAGLRLWAVVRRGWRVVDLRSRFPAPEPVFARGPKSASPRESVLREALLERSAESAGAVLAGAPPLPVSVPARQVLWVRFPQGLQDTVATGDVLSAEVTMAVASDASLDFLCLPPRSAVWGKVLQTSATEGVRTVRIHFFKAALAGGHTVPISARVTDAAGDQPLVKVSPGGSLVLGEAVSLDEKKKRRGSRILAPDVRLRLELAAPMSITEPPQFYQAGAGLWIRTGEAASGRVFEVTHVIAGRSAEKAGVRVGDQLTAIEGRPTSGMDFGDALAALYGKPGSLFKATVRKPGLEKPSTFELKRGVVYKDGVETPVPLPFEKKGKS
jgi:membrane-associated protease RseP (regulator of RpoE activity)